MRGLQVVEKGVWRVFLAPHFAVEDEMEMG